MKLEMQADAMLLKGRETTISVIEYQGQTEVVVQGKRDSVRITNDTNGIHVDEKKPNRQPAG